MKASLTSYWAISALFLLVVCTNIIYQCQSEFGINGHGQSRKVAHLFIPINFSDVRKSPEDEQHKHMTSTNRQNSRQDHSNGQENELVSDRLKSSIGQTVYEPSNILTQPSSHIRRKRKVSSRDDLLWDREIYWTLENMFNSTEQAIIQSALDHWQSNTCLSFWRKDNITTGPYLIFIKSEICSSLLGRIGDFVHDIEIGNKCLTMGKVAHEIGHVLGMFHEHSRPDRDNYVTVNFENVEDGLQPNFDIAIWEVARTEGIPYDYGSAMHYGQKTFAKAGKITLATKEWGYEQTIGQRRAMSFYDFKIINSLYCSQSCGGESLTWALCNNDGYRDPNDCSNCICPEGFRPPFCSLIQGHDNDLCQYQYRYSSLYSWGNISSPVYPNGYSGPAACYWMITSYRGSRVVIQFEEPFLFRCATNACEDYIEIRSGDLARTGTRFCCSAPSTRIKTSGNRVMILFRSEVTNSSLSRFRLRYRSEGCGGCLYRHADSQHACSLIRIESCSGTFKSPCKAHINKMCVKSRKNVCYRTRYTCCRGYRLDGDMCMNIRRLK